MPDRIATIDFHVTSECNQECPYCWGPQDFQRSVDTAEALRIISHVKEVGARRIVFTGGDPLKRADILQLIRHAHDIGLEVALSTTGDELTPEFLEAVAPLLDLISLPLDGSSEALNARTKEAGHFDAIMRALEWLRQYPEIDVKVCTPVTRQNLRDVDAILGLVQDYACTTDARVFYNIFQAFPRAMGAVDWDELVVSDHDFNDLQRRLKASSTVRVNFLDHATLDRLYVMIFPDGSLVIPRGSDYPAYGPFLEVQDLDTILEAGSFDSEKHLRHSRGWVRSPRAGRPAAGVGDEPSSNG